MGTICLYARGSGRIRGHKHFRYVTWICYIRKHHLAYKYGHENEMYNVGLSLKDVECL